MSQYVNYSVQLPHDLREKLKRLASAQGRKCSDQVRFQIAQAYAEKFPDAIEAKSADVPQGAQSNEGRRDDY